MGLRRHGALGPSPLSRPAWEASGSLGPRPLSAQARTLHGPPTHRLPFLGDSGRRLSPTDRPCAAGFPILRQSRDRGKGRRGLVYNYYLVPGGDQTFDSRVCVCVCELPSHI
jgi:hypothetical protein